MNKYFSAVGLLLLALVLIFAVTERSRAQTAPAPGVRWEYKLLTGSYLSERELNDLGKEGWEAVTATPTEIAEGSLRRWSIIMKRPLK
ncbi:DUF4177 domain-containing protein [Verrucomicrobium sp. GAS474]|uniref:DUF4177 domain-containing protein n=1 Tax=Verrucomicrobium sp. GAS474 TaxID=1882831 RepID=UPI0012FFA85B|nr:DUF4177 domain-containing protein [Verrucomicrobium sp. GAS474]